MNATRRCPNCRKVFRSMGFATHFAACQTKPAPQPAKDHFNQLSPAAAERLAILAEECGEVVQIIGKILRHGYDSAHPDSGEVNRQSLTQECGDVLAAIELLADADDLNHAAVEQARKSKHARIGLFLHHQPTRRCGP